MDSVAVVCWRGARLITSAATGKVASTLLPPEVTCSRDPIQESNDLSELSSKDLDSAKSPINLSVETLQETALQPIHAPVSQLHLNLPPALLPNLKLPKFSGQVTKWPSFWDQFQAAVGSTNMEAISKFTYLKNLLLGEAARCIGGLSLTAAHYHLASELLEKRYGR